MSLYCGESSRPYHWIQAAAPSGYICQTRYGKGVMLSKCSENGKYIPLQSIFSEGPMEKVIVIMGTNSLANRVADRNYEQLSKYLKEISGQCFWISPPHLRPDQSKTNGHVLTELQSYQDDFYLSLTTSVANHCTLLDSRKYTLPGSAASETSDGIHRTIRAGQAWGAQILQDIERQSSR